MAMYGYVGLCMAVYTYVALCTAIGLSRAMYGYVVLCKALYHILGNGEPLYDAYTRYLPNF